MELRLHGNKLTNLPDSSGELAALRELHLDGNALEGLPHTFDQLSELRVLSFRTAAG